MTDDVKEPVIFNIRQEEMGALNEFEKWNSVFR
ncbi:MAG: hypothetical protein K0R53_206 [Burkholderiales bacterium]|jgi:hypothetical protein|nr:hypothetical protein [Burkholderiales bacterium]